MSKESGWIHQFAGKNSNQHDTDPPLSIAAREGFAAASEEEAKRLRGLGKDDSAAALEQRASHWRQSVSDERAAAERELGERTNSEAVGDDFATDNPTDAMFDGETGDGADPE